MTSRTMQTHVYVEFGLSSKKSSEEFENTHVKCYQMSKKSSA